MTVLSPERAPAPARPARPAAPRRRRGHRVAALVLAGPFTALLAGTVLVPVLYALYLSLFTDRLSGLGFAGPHQVFVGLGNYLSVLGDRAYHTGLVNVALFMLIHLPLMLGMALVLALMLDSAMTRLRRLWSLAVFLPYAVPGVITGLIWGYLYSPEIGPLTAILPFDPLSAGAILPSVVNIATWQWVGYNMIILYTALLAVPTDLIDAARADGAGGVRIALSVKVPVIRPAVAVAAMFTVIGSLQLFTEPLVLHNFTGAATLTWTPNLYLYQSAFVANDYGRAAAASVLLALVCAALSALVMRAAAGRSR